MRADRLIQALLLLQGRESLTAAELAAELEVSVPTARRDLEALLGAGVPIYPQPGRGGGWRLIGGARTDLTGLTGPEATALFLQLVRTGADSDAATRARRKVVQALPASFRAAAERIAAATVVGPERGAGPGEPEPDEAALLQQAIADERLVSFEYGAERRTLEVVPLVVGRRGRRWYLMAAPAHPGTETADAARLRTYRVDRMGGLRALRARGRAPAGFVPGEAWDAMVTEMEARRGAASATVSVEAHAVAPLCSRFGVHARVIEEGDERSVVEVRAQSDEALAEQLAGWTPVARVIEPASVTRALADLGAQLVATYGSEGTARVR